MSVRCHDLGWDIEKGKEVADYLMERSRENPFFAVASAVMHSGPITYTPQQKYVERMVLEDPRNFIDPAYAKEAVRGSQLWEGRALILPRATKCFVRHCSRNECLKPKGREKLVGCLQKSGVQRTVAGGKRTGVGFGQKILDLTREYLGDSNAVAVDRHVKNWACKRAKLVCPKNPKELKRDSVTAKTYRAVADAVRRKASECGLKPAELQVAAWLSGACREEAPKGKPLYIGKGKSIYCIHRRVPPLTRWMEP